MNARDGGSAKPTCFRHIKKQVQNILHAYNYDSRLTQM